LAAVRVRGGRHDVAEILPILAKPEVAKVTPARIQVQAVTEPGPEGLEVLGPRQEVVGIVHDVQARVRAKLWRECRQAPALEELLVREMDVA
jgi:hypothetical protein